jgi:adenine deaminase
VYQAGRLVARDGACVDPSDEHYHSPVLRSSINVHWLEPDDFVIRVDGTGSRKVHVIEVVEDEITTGRSVEEMPIEHGVVNPDPARDLVKIAVIERHQASGNVGLAFARGFGLTSGAIASSVAHDSHNIVVAGTNNLDMFEAAVHLVKTRGGLCVVRDGRVLADVSLPIAGLMSKLSAEELRRELQALRTATAQLDCKLHHPFMAMSFLSLSVIGQLRVTDQGLVDVERFEKIDLFVND